MSILPALSIAILLQTAPEIALSEAHRAEANAASKCLEALRTDASGGSACEAYKGTVRALRAAGGDAAVKESNWEKVGTAWRQRAYNEYVRNYGAAFQR
jgi:hypothetical protein